MWSWRVIVCWLINVRNNEVRDDLRVKETGRIDDWTNRMSSLCALNFLCNNVVLLNVYIIYQISFSIIMNMYMYIIIIHISLDDRTTELTKYLEVSILLLFHPPLLPHSSSMSAHSCNVIYNVGVQIGMSHKSAISVEA